MNGWYRVIAMEIRSAAQRLLQVGEPASWFVCRSPVNPQLQFQTVAGRYVVLWFFGSSSNPGSRRVIDDVLASRGPFDDVNVCFFGVSIDPEDEAQGRVQNVLAGVRFFWDFDRSVSRSSGRWPTIAAENAEFEGGNVRFPEFGPQTYKAPPGGSVVFSCSLLHEATPITKRKRYAFNPFLYDDAAAKIRQQNQKFLSR